MALNYSLESRDWENTDVSVEIDNPNDFNGIKDDNKTTALSFDGVDDSVKTDTAFFPSGDTLTLEVWLNIRGKGDNSWNIIAELQDGDGNNRVGLYWDEDNYLYGAFDNNGGGKAHLSGNDPNLNEWEHWACVVDGSNNELRFYIDGKLRATDTNSGSFPDLKLSIGRRYDLNDMFNGVIGDVRIWDIARTQTEIQDNMHKKLNGDETGLVAYYKMDEGNGSILTDSAGSNDGTIYGATWVESWNNGSAINNLSIETSKIRLINPLPEYNYASFDITKNLSDENLNEYTPSSDKYTYLEDVEDRKNKAVYIMDDTVNNIPSQDYFTNSYSTYDSTTKEYTLTLPANDTNSWRGPILKYSPTKVMEPAGSVITFSYEAYSEEVVPMYMDLNNYGMTTSTGSNDNTQWREFPDDMNTEPGKWKKIYATYKVDADQDYYTRNRICFGNGYSPDHEVTVKVRNIQHERKPYPTTFVDGTRVGGGLAYSPSQFGVNFNDNNWTVLCLVKYQETMTAGTRSSVFELGSYYIANETCLAVGVRQGTNRLVIYGYENKSGFSSSSITFTEAEAQDWMLVALTYDGTNLMLHTNSKDSGYRNVSRATSWDTAANPIRDNLFVGRYGWNNGTLKGHIDNLLVLPYTLSPEEIQNLKGQFSIFEDENVGERESATDISSLNSIANSNINWDTEESLYLNNGDYVVTKNNLAGGDPTITISVWAKTTEANPEDWCGIFGLATGSTTNTTLTINHELNDGMTLHTWGNSTAFTPLKPGWHHYVAVNTGAAHQLFYADGQLVGEMNQALTIPEGRMVIGKRSGVIARDGFGKRTWHGNIGDVRVYEGTVLTATEILDLYNGSNITKGITSHYEMKNITGNIIPDSVGNNDCQIIEGLLLDGDNSVEIPHSTTLDITQEITLQVTLDLRILFAEMSNPYPAFIDKSNQTYRFGVYSSSTNKVGLRLNYGTSERMQYEYTTDKTGLVTFTATYDGINIKIYEDGVLKLSEPGSYPIHTDTSNVNLGVGLEGVMLEAQIWDKALTEAEINNNLNKKLTGSEAGLVSYYKFDDKKGTTLTDYAGNNNGNIINKPKWIGAKKSSVSVQTSVDNQLTWDDNIKNNEIPNLKTQNPDTIYTKQILKSPNLFDTPFLTNCYLDVETPTEYKWDLNTAIPSNWDELVSIKDEDTTTADFEEGTLTDVIAVDDRLELCQSVKARGGTEKIIEQDGQKYKVHVFDNVGSNTIEFIEGGNIEVLVVAGGGSTGYDSYANGGGGGAGGYRHFTDYYISPGNISITVGDGATPNDLRGGNSSFGLISATGGGYGGSHNGLQSSGADGGSGGGGRGGSSNASPGLGNMNDYGPVEGYHGAGNTVTPGGGGGSAETAPHDNGRGGHGTLNNITGEEVYYAGGGCGGRTSYASNGVTDRDSDGAPNTGSGAGASSDSSYSSGYHGGSGIVVVRYKISTNGTRQSPQLDLSSIEGISQSKIQWNGFTGLGFNGMNDYVDLGMNLYGESQVSIEFEFIWEERTSSYQSVIGNFKDFADAFGIRTNKEGDGRYQFVFYTEQNDVGANIGIDVDLKTKHHLAYTFDNGNVEIYLDGESVGTSTFYDTTTPVLNENFKLAGGFILSTFDYFKGSVSEVRFWKTRRTQQEIQDNMNKKLNGDETGLYAYYPADEGSGSTLYDNAGSNDGVINSSSWLETLIETSVDGGSTWDEATNGDSIPNLNGNTNTLDVKQTLSTTSTTVKPILKSLNVEIEERLIQSSDGAWYLHARYFEDNQPVTEYKGTFNVDKTPPTSFWNLTECDWTPTFPDVTSTNDGGLSGLKTAKMQVTDSTAKPSSWINDSTVETSSYKSSFDNDRFSMGANKDGQWYCHLELEDNVGNVLHDYVGLFKIDQTPPTLSWINDSSEWQAEVPDLRCTNNDATSGIDTAKWQITTSTDKPTSWSTDSTPAQTVFLNTLSSKGDGEWYVHIEVFDNAGNSTYDYRFVKIDTTPPEISSNTLSIDSPTGIYDNYTATVTWDVADVHVGTDHTEIALYIDGSWYYTNASLPSGITCDKTMDNITGEGSFTATFSNIPREVNIKIGWKSYDILSNSNTLIESSTVFTPRIIETRSMYSGSNYEMGVTKINNSPSYFTIDVLSKSKSSPSKYQIGVPKPAFSVGTLYDVGISGQDIGPTEFVIVVFPERPAIIRDGKFNYAARLGQADVQVDISEFTNWSLSVYQRNLWAKSFNHFIFLDNGSLFVNGQINDGYETGWFEHDSINKTLTIKKEAMDIDELLVFPKTLTLEEIKNYTNSSFYDPNRGVKTKKTKDVYMKIL